MSRRVVIDLSQFMRSPAGGSAIRRRWLDGLARLAPLHARAVAGNFPPELPGAEALAAASAELARGSFGKGKGGLAVLGQPGALGSLRAWLDACAGEGIRLHASAPVADPAKTWLALLGPPWIDTAVETASAHGTRVAVATGRVDGEPIEPPPRGLWIDDAHAGDARLGALGLATLAAIGAAGIDVNAALAGAREVRAQVDGPPGIDNPGWSLARALRLCETELGRDSVIHVAGEGRLAGLAEWAARVQAATVGRLRRDGTGRALPAVAEAGDEEWLEAVAHGPRSRVIVAWIAGPDLPGGAAAPWVACAAESGQVVLRVRLGALDAGSVGAAMALWLRAMACLALLEESEAMPLSAVGRLYDAMEADGAAGAIDEARRTD
ncbi:MAG: hypothetical protein FJ090_18000 [Deltaproteobacteria bacterium]|nr:hypothetical protein [Deltaproteobacteria bacterium]